MHSRRTPSRPSFLWLQVLLVAALACIVLILAESFRAARAGHAVADRALRDYAGFAAWSYREHLTMAFRAGVDELLGPVNHGDQLHTVPGYPDVMQMGHYIGWNAECACHRPRGPMPLQYIGFTLGTDTVKIAPNFAPKSTKGWLADVPVGTTVPASIGVSRDEALWLNQLLSRVARRLPRSSWGYDVTVAQRENRHRIFASRSMPMVNGDTVVYVVEYSAAAMDSLLRAVLSARDLLPPSLVATRANDEVLDVEVTDAAGAVLFRTASDTRWDLPATASLPESYGDLRIRTQMRPAMASVLLIGGLPQSRVPLLLVLLVITVVLCVLAAVQLRREARFASERSTFVANVSHELRTPLTQVRLVLDMLRLGRAGDETAREHALGVADREVLRLQHLVEGVLRFARGPRRNDAPRVPTDVLTEVQAVAREFQPLATPRGIQVRVEGDEGVTVALQNGALRQVMLNLLDNAVKYGRDNAEVHVDVRNRTDGGVRISVRDHGPGVPTADRERIWRAFERGENALQRASGGSGIGLTIVTEIVAEHRGRAFVEDAPDGGARFVIEFDGARD